MAEKKRDARKKTEATEKGPLADKLVGLKWGLFFIWLGLVLLLKLGAGVGLLGIGVIALGVQVSRKYFKLSLEWFWVIVGLLFTLVGLWDVFETTLPLVAVLLIVAGLTLLIFALQGKSLMREKALNERRCSTRELLALSCQLTGNIRNPRNQRAMLCS